MAGQRVHRLSAANARDELHGQRIDLGLGQCVNDGFVAIGFEQRGEACASFHCANFGIGRATHFDDEIGAADAAIGAHFGARIFVILIRHARAHAGARRDRDHVT